MNWQDKIDEKIGAWREEIRLLDDEPLVKDVVKLYWQGLDIIRRMTDELESLRDGIAPTTSRISASLGGHSGGHGDPTAETVFRIDLLSRQIDEVKKDNHCLAVDIDWFIRYEINSPQEQTIYRMRTLDRLHYAEIASKTNYTDGYCRNVISRYNRMTTVK